nr:integrase, catalytic region, zinc finger, CCHC-type, peptidase aspartic, catalytic [Tanacetum cinerariifolium]
MVRGYGENQFRQYAGQNVGNLNGCNDVQNVKNQTGNGNLVAARAEGNAAGLNGNQIRCYNCRGVEEFDLMVAAADLDEIKEVNANCILMANLQQASTSGTQTDKAPVYDLDGSAENDIKTHNWSSSAHQELHKIINDEIFPIVNQVDARVQIFEIQFLKEAVKFVGDFKSLAKEADESLAKHKALELEIERLLRAVNVISKVVCAMCKKCLISVNHDVCLCNYVNGKTSRGKKQKANVLIKEKQKKYQPKVKKTKKVGLIERLATPKPRKSRFLLRWSPTERLFDPKGKIIESSESESQSDYSNGDNACTYNTLEPKIKRFPNSTSLLGRVYFVEELGHNLFSVGQFCDSDLEVAFRRNACFALFIVLLELSPPFSFYCTS